MSPRKTVAHVAKQVANKKKKERTKFNPEEFISSGSTLLNLALTDHPDCGWQLGKMVNTIGASSAGKTILALTAYAEAAADKRFNDHRFIYDDAENANEFDMVNLFGKKMARRIESPRVIDGEDVPSDTVEDFHDNIVRALKKGVPFIYTLDSFDSLTAEADREKLEEMRTAREKGNKVAGSYQMAKPKKASSLLQDICGKLKSSNSFLNIISQTRDNIDPMSFSKVTRSGGRALKFYATHELWLSVAKAIKAKERIIGNYVIIKVEKNKITGKKRSITIPIYYDYGIDDVGSMISFLADEKIWTKAEKGGSIDTNGDLGLKKSMKLQALIEHIEDNELESELREITVRAWHDIEESLKLGRKSKYA